MKIKSLKGIISTVLAAALLGSSVTACGIKEAAQTTLEPAAAAEAPAESHSDLYFDPDDAGVVYEEEQDYTQEAPAMEDNKGYEDEDGLAYCVEAAEEAEYDTGAQDTYANSYSLRANKQLASKGSYLDSAYDSYRDEQDYQNSEEYADVDEQGFKSVRKHPLSTFAADVDTASYANLRRMLSEGYRLEDIPDGAVRIEEMINYFDYDYKGPKGSEPFGVNTELSYCPWNEDALLMSIGLKTEDIDFSETPDSNLVFLIDVSGSMSDYDKLPLLQEAFCMLVDELSDKDRVSIVTYANGVDTVLAGEKGSNGRKIKRAINDLFAAGGTNGGEGIQTAYKLAEKNFIKGGNNRVILATDGDLNIGITSADELEKLISKKKESGVFLSVLGFGTGNIKDDRMETLADKGNGNYSYIDSVKEAKKVMVDELSANLLTVCKDVKLQVEFNPAVVKGYRLVGYANRVMKDKDFEDDKKDGGEIGAGHEVTVLYELIPADEYADLLSMGDYPDTKELRYADQFKKTDRKTDRIRMTLDDDSEILTLSIRFKRPSENKSSLLTYPVTLESFTDRPSDEFLFKTAVAEFGLLASDSLYSEDADLDNLVERLYSINLDDDYKEEFRDMISGL